MNIRISKQKIVRKMLVTKRGEVKNDQIKLPDNALAVSNVHLTAQHLALAPTGPIRIYYGVSTLTAPTRSMVEALHTKTYTGEQVDWDDDAGISDYLYYAHPMGLMDPTFNYGGFTGGFLNLGVLTITTLEGDLSYRVWRSLNKNLGDTSVLTTH